MTNCIVRVALVFVLTTALLPAAAFTNGSFETPVISGFDFTIVPTGWVKTDPTNSGLFLENYSAFSLPTAGGAGTQAYGFGGNGVTTGNLAQTFDTNAGGTYQVTFQYLIQQGLEFESLLAQALNGATVLGSDTEIFNNTAWVTKAFSFTATSSATTLRFSDNTGAALPGTGSGTNWALDAVTVTQTGGPTGGAVPEPSGFAMMGLTALAIARLRKRVSV